MIPLRSWARGKKPFVVIDDRIMAAQDGKLKPFQQVGGGQATDVPSASSEQRPAERQADVVVADGGGSPIWQPVGESPQASEND